MLPQRSRPSKSTDSFAWNERETTRALGSDIEGLQQEIRRLAALTREYLTSVPTLTATGRRVTVAAAPGRRVRGRTAQRSAGRFVASGRPVTGHAGLGDASTGSATGVPPADRFDSGRPAGDGQPATARRVAAQRRLRRRHGRRRRLWPRHRPVMPPSAMSRPGMPSSATQRPATPPPAPPRPRHRRPASAIPPARAAAPLSPLCPTTHGHAARPARQGPPISPPPFTPRRPRRRQQVSQRRRTRPAPRHRSSQPAALVWRGSVTTWELCARNRPRPHRVGARRRRIRCRPRLPPATVDSVVYRADPRAMACRAGAVCAAGSVRRDRRESGVQGHERQRHCPGATGWVRRAAPPRRARLRTRAHRPDGMSGLI